MNEALALRSLDFHVSMPLTKPIGRAARLSENEGFPWWFALRVPPQKEFLAEDGLNVAGFKIFVPCEYRERRRGRLKKPNYEPLKIALLPTYILVRFDRPPIPWRRLMDFPLIHSIVGSPDKEGICWPRRIPQQAVDILSQISVTTKEKPLKPAKTQMPPIKIGNFAIPQKGAFIGQLCRVQEVDNGRARVLLGLLGAEAEFWLDLELFETA